MSPYVFSCSSPPSLIDFCQFSPNCLNASVPARVMAFCQFSCNSFIVFWLDSLIAFDMTSLYFSWTSELVFCRDSKSCIHFFRSFVYSAHRVSQSLVLLVFDMISYHGII